MNNDLTYAEYVRSTRTGHWRPRGTEADRGAGGESSSYETPAQRIHNHPQCSGCRGMEVKLRTLQRELDEANEMVAGLRRTQMSPEVDIGTGLTSSSLYIRR